MSASYARRRLVVLVASAALAMPFAVAARDAAKAAAPTKDAVPAKEGAPQALRFGKDSAHASVKGKFKGPKDVVRNYAIDLKAGDTYAVAVDDGKSHVTFFSVFAPGAPQREGEGRTRMDVKANVDGAYIIHVFMTQGAVVKGASSTYELTVTKS